MICSAHKYHYPAPLTIELHHIIPQAWQNYILGAEKLFDKRTAALCPTCHRNVHWWIVKLMHGADRVRRIECQIAGLALDRWVAAGHTIEELQARGLWGNA